MPNVNYQSLGSAQQVLNRAGLKATVIDNDSIDPRATVTSQAPGFGAQVAPGSAIQLTTQLPSQPGGTPPAQGISKLIVTNTVPSGNALYLWSFDNGTGQWAKLYDGNVLTRQQSTTISLDGGHTVQLYAVDPQSCNGENDPQASAACVAGFTPPLSGNSNGATVNWSIGAGLAY